MGLEDETLVYILKQYYKGKKDNLPIILLELKNIVIKKYNDFNLKQEEIKTLIKLLIHAVDTYSFEKSSKFKNYINLYLSMSLTEYQKEVNVTTTEQEESEFLEEYIEDILQTIEKNNEKSIKLV